FTLAKIVVSNNPFSPASVQAHIPGSRARWCAPHPKRCERIRAAAAPNCAGPPGATRRNECNGELIVIDNQRLAAALRSFASERDWDQFHTPKNLATSISVEASELLELFLWSRGQKGWEEI